MNVPHADKYRSAGGQSRFTTRAGKQSRVRVGEREVHQSGDIPWILVIGAAILLLWWIF